MASCAIGLKKILVLQNVFNGKCNYNEIPNLYVAHGNTKSQRNIAPFPLRKRF